MVLATVSDLLPPYLLATTTAIIVGCLTVLLVLLARRRRNRRVDGKKPRSAAWLEELWQPNLKKAPHALRGRSTGLRPMAKTDWIRIEPSAVFTAQMKYRRALLSGDATHGRRFYVTGGDEGRAAEAEVLQVLLEHLETHCTDSHRVVRGPGGDATAVIDKYSDERFEVAAYAACPLRLAAMLVQEDFILLSPPPSPRFVCGCALFSFMEIGLEGEKGNMKRGQDLLYIHKNVPGFNAPGSIQSMLQRFLAGLKAEVPHYRTNWIFVPKVGLDPMAYDLKKVCLARQESGALPGMDTDAPVDALQLRVEFQSVRRLPRSRHILFTLHTYSDPLPSLRHTPKAAAVLRHAVLALDAEKREYRQMSDERTKEVIALLGQLAGKWV